MTWEQGRNLKTATNSTTNTTVVSANKVDTEISQAYTYDADGIRTGKTSTTKIYKYRASGGGGTVASVGDNVSEPNATTYVRYLYSTTTTAHHYITQNGKVVRETIGSGTTAKVLDFIYDESGKPFALRYTNGTATPVTYYYVLNLQGDVVGLLNSSGTLVVRYDYNAWGEILSVTNAAGTAITSETNIANLNPLRYRGYYYDTETGFYYLQSRYYDPVTHRFINADSIASTGLGFVGTNMFAYCNNSPALFVDVGGNIPAFAIHCTDGNDGPSSPIRSWKSTETYVDPDVEIGDPAYGVELSITPDGPTGTIYGAAGHADISDENMPVSIVVDMLSVEAGVSVNPNSVTYFWGAYIAKVDFGIKTPIGTIVIGGNIGFGQGCNRSADGIYYSISYFLGVGIGIEWS